MLSGNSQNQIKKLRIKIIELNSKAQTLPPEKATPLLNEAYQLLQNYHDQFNDEDWRLLAITANGLYVASGYKNVHWLEKAISAQLSVKEFTRNDWIFLAKHQFTLSTRYTNFDQCLQFAYGAVDSFSHVPDLQASEYLDLVDYQFNVGWFTKDNEQKSKWYKKAIDTLVSKPDFTIDNWRRLAALQDHIAHVCDNDKDAFVWENQAINSMLTIKVLQDDTLSPEDALQLACYQSSTSGYVTDLEKRLEFQNKALKTLLTITNCDAEALKMFRTVFHNLGNIYAALNQLHEAQQSFYLAVNKHIELPNKTLADFEEIEKTYEDWRELFVENSLEQTFFDFVLLAFNDQHNKDYVKNEFYKFYCAISLLSEVQPIHKYFLQFMRVVQDGIQNELLKDHRLTRWLEEENELARFTIIAQEIQTHCEKCDELTKTIAQHPSFWIAMTQKLTSMETTIDKLQKKVSTLENQNTQLSNMLRSNFFASAVTNSPACHPEEHSDEEPPFTQRV